MTRHRNQTKNRETHCPICFVEYTILPQRRIWREKKLLQDCQLVLEKFLPNDDFLVKTILYDYLAKDSLSAMRICLHKTRRQTHTACLECVISWLIDSILYKSKYELDYNGFRIRMCIKRGLQICNKKTQKHIQPCDKKVNLTFILLQLPPIYPSFLNENTQQKLCKLCRGSFDDICRIPVRGLLEQFHSRRLTLLNSRYYECFNRECNQIIKRTKEKIKTCKKCKTEWCQFCFSEPHDESCAERKMKTFDEETLKELKKKGPNRKIAMCGNCGNLLAKISGCNHVTCESVVDQEFVGCGAHMCWKCGKMFETSNKVYSHLFDKNSLCYGVF